jgi:hypothetical protein
MRASGYALARASGRKAGANANRAGDSVPCRAPTSAPMLQGHEKKKRGGGKGRNSEKEKEERKSFIKKKYHG